MNCRWPAALTQSILGGGQTELPAIRRRRSDLSGYGGRGSVRGLATIIAAILTTQSSVGASLKKQLLLYTEELKAVNVIKRSTDPAKFAEAHLSDVLS